ncbi:hypothetical protein [Pseudorhodobacter wandonensis]|uniref:hypothetical protein n=1 Tax=Pseudorhodobacter wandonensis TaxID=1120568 RepID=UPI000A98EB43|nr:hypothetical protein [Pseudorhodobacter wandonensis]
MATLTADGRVDSGGGCADGGIDEVAQFAWPKFRPKLAGEHCGQLIAAGHGA